jgi:hypothetical protein
MPSDLSLIAGVLQTVIVHLGSILSPSNAMIDSRDSYPSLASTRWLRYASRDKTPVRADSKPYPLLSFYSWIWGVYCHAEGRQRLSVLDGEVYMNCSPIMVWYVLGSKEAKSRIDLAGSWG